jgi:fucose permease
MKTSAPVLLLLAYLAFISLGLPDTVLGVAWPSLRANFGISQSSIGAVLAAGMAGYFSSGLWAGMAVSRLGVGGLLAASSGLVALALLGFALAPSWGVFFPMGIVMGLGSGAIDSGLNGYAAVHFSVRHINWLHACWGIGASTGPALMTAAIARGYGYRAGYGVLTAVLGGMALLFLLTRRRWDTPSPPAAAAITSAAPAASSGVTEEPSSAAAAKDSERRLGFKSALSSGRVWLQIVTFFFYTGVESCVGQWCFSWMRERRGLPIEQAGFWTSAYWASLTLGRVVLGGVVDRIGPDRLLRMATVGVVTGTALFASSEGWLGRAGLLLTGASLAPMFPTLMARTPARVGEGISHHAVGFQVSAATLGSSLMPALAGVLVSGSGLGAIGGLVVALGCALLVSHEALFRAAHGVGVPR